MVFVFVKPKTIKRQNFKTYFPQKFFYSPYLLNKTSGSCTR